MKYYDVNGNEIAENEIDLTKGYLTVKESIQHNAITHITETKLKGGTVITNTVLDSPAYEEVTAYTYTEYEVSTEPTQIERIEAQALYTAMMTDTLIEE